MIWLWVVIQQYISSHFRHIYPRLFPVHLLQGQSPWNLGLVVLLEATAVITSCGMPVYCSETDFLELSYSFCFLADYFLFIRVSVRFICFQRDAGGFFSSRGLSTTTLGRITHINTHKLKLPAGADVYMQLIWEDWGIILPFRLVWGSIMKLGCFWVAFSSHPVLITGKTADLIYLLSVSSRPTDLKKCFCY